MVLLVVGCCRSNWLGVDHPCCWGFYSVSNLKGTLNAWYIDPYLMRHFLWFKCIPGSPVNCFKKNLSPGCVNLKHEKRNDGRIPGKYCQNNRVLESQRYGIDGIDVIP